MAEDQTAIVNRLQAAFALHPWVERVTAVRLRGPDGPRVDLVLRTPALAAGGRVLDAQGVLLPDAAPADRLIRWQGAFLMARAASTAACPASAFQICADTAGRTPAPLG